MRSAVSGLSVKTICRRTVRGFGPFVPIRALVVDVRVVYIVCCHPAYRSTIKPWRSRSKTRSEMQLTCVVCPLVCAPHTHRTSTGSGRTGLLGARESEEGKVPQLAKSKEGVRGLHPRRKGLRTFTLRLERLAPLHRDADDTRCAHVRTVHMHRQAHQLRFA
eukprot:SAG11_NODE_80_length_17731_cov_13.985254_12_plen_162_part_00